MKKLLTLVVLMNLLAPGTTNAGSVTDATYFDGRNVYIRLVKQEDGWHFSDRLSLKPGRNDERGMDILLNDLSIPSASRHNFTVRMECIPMGHCSANGNNYRNRKEALSSMVTPWTGPFYRSQLNVGSTLVSNTLGVVLTVGLATGSSDSDYSFDQQAFEQALAEAVVADGMTDARRRRIIEEVEQGRSQEMAVSTVIDKVALAN